LRIRLFVDGSARSLLLPRLVSGEIPVREWVHEYRDVWYSWTVVGEGSC
jgi:hypothetical protein